MATLIGQTLGKYQIIERLGRGGMAEVYKVLRRLWKTVLHVPGFLRRHIKIKKIRVNPLNPRNPRPIPAMAEQLQKMKVKTVVAIIGYLPIFIKLTCLRIVVY